MNEKLPSPISKLTAEHELGRALIIVGGGRVGTLLFSLAATMLLTNTLSPEEFAAFGVLFSLVSFLVIITLLGFQTSIIRYAAERRAAHDDEAGRRMGLLALGTSGATALVIGAALIAAGSRVGWPASGETLTLVLTATWLIAMTFNRLIGEWLRGLNDLLGATLFNGMGQFGGLANVALITAIAGFWALFGDLTLNVVLASCTSAFVMSSLTGLARARDRLGGRLQPIAASPRSDAVWKTNGFLLGAELLRFGTGIQASVLIAGALLPAEQVALYFVAVRLFAMVSTALVTVNQASAELIVRLTAEGRRADLERVLRVGASATMLIALSAAAVIALLMPTGFSLAFGEMYRDAYGISLVLVSGAVASAALGSGARALSLLGHEATVLKAQSILAVLNVTATTLGTFYFGLLGLTVASVASILLTFFVMAWLTWLRLDVACWAYVNPIAYISLVRDLICLAAKKVRRIAPKSP